MASGKQSDYVLLIIGALGRNSLGIIRAPQNYSNPECDRMAVLPVPWLVFRGLTSGLAWAANR